SVPAERMKGGRDHRVPLTKRAVEIVRRAMELSGSEGYVFASPSRRSRALSENTMNRVAKRLAVDLTAHGFRSSFRDWASERTNFPREVCEMALSHAIKNKTEAAYRRGDLFDKRQKLMAAWAQYAFSPVAEVVKLRAG